MRILTYPIAPPSASQPKKAVLMVYLQDQISSNPNKLRPAVVICPGGGYRRISDRENTPVVTQFLAMGCHVMVLDYSVAPVRFPGALQELAASVALVRRHSAGWMVNPEKIIVCGFSAGGHLACSLGAFWNQDFVSAPLGLSADDVRPDGMILCYPVITTGSDCHEDSFINLLGESADDSALRKIVSLELQVGAHTPKTFLWHTWTDQAVSVANSLFLAQSLHKAGVNLEMHIYPAGCHGLSLATEEVSSPDGIHIEPQCQSWISLVKTWLQYF